MEAAGARRESTSLLLRRPRGCGLCGTFLGISIAMENGT